MKYEIHEGDSVEVMAGMPEASVDAIVTDPPYGLEFMGKEWDKLDGDAWRTGGGFSKPGIGERQTPWVSFGSGDTANATCATCGGRMRGAKKCNCAEPQWRVKGKPLGESAADSRQAQGRKMQLWHEGWAREAFRVLKPGGRMLAFSGTRTSHRMVCAIEDAGFVIEDTIMWVYGSGFPKHKSKLKPAYEPITVARKGHSSHLNIDACRIGIEEGDSIHAKNPHTLGGFGHAGASVYGDSNGAPTYDPSAGRWPANVILDEEAGAMLDEQSGALKSGGKAGKAYDGYQVGDQFLGGFNSQTGILYADSGGASRFFLNVKTEVLCELCLLPKHDTMSATEDAQSCLNGAKSAEPNTRPNGASNGLAPENAAALLPLETGGNSPNGNKSAHNAEPSLKSTPATNGSTAHCVVWDSLTEHLIPLVRSAASLCERCVIAIARSIAATRRGHDPASTLGQAFISERKKQTLLRCLVLYAESLGSTDTIPTTASLNLFIGYALHAIANTTTPESDAHSFASAPQRFAYVSKASRAERNAGLEGMPERDNSHRYGDTFSKGRNPVTGERTETYNTKAQNHHPTVKPLALMRWLVRLVTLEGGTVLDPFAGSGTTGVACIKEGFNFIGIERDAEYAEIARRRIEAARDSAPLFSEAVA